jgi:NitT/TauT family transport system substrate-binding protein
MIRKLLSGIAVFSIFLTACAAPRAEDTALKIGVLPILDALPMYVAEAQDYYKQNGVAVEFVPVASAAERDQLMQAGQIDGMINDIVSSVLYNKDTPKIGIVRIARAASPDTAQYAVLAARDSGIAKPEDLKGVPIGISEGTVIAYVTDRLLQQAGLAAEDIQTTNVPKINERMQLLGEGQLKAATLPAPSSLLAEQGGATVVVDDRANPKVGNSVISFSVGALKDKPNTVRKFLAALDKAVADVNADATRWDSLLTDKKLVPAPLVGKYQLPKFPAAGVPDEAQVKDVEDWMMAKGLLQAEVAYDKLVRPEFVK